MSEVYVAGVGMTPFGKFPERGLKSLGSEAVHQALADASVDVADVEAAYVGNAVGGLVTQQEMIRGQVVLRPMGFSGIPIFNIENACASASSAAHLAWQAVESGRHDVVLALGVEKLTHPDKQVSFNAIGTAIDLETRVESVGSAGPQDRSYFMDIYASMATEFMERSGATPEDFADVVVKSRRHAALNERAQYREPVDRAAVLASREVVSPLTLLMCSPIGDGAAAVVLLSEAGRRRFQQPAGRTAVRVRASVVRSGSARTGAGEKSAPAAVRAAYDQAGVGPEDIDCAEVHDASAPAELMLYESLGFARAEDAPRLLAEGVTALGGRKPVNTSGGLLCKGHPIGATGIAQLSEVTWQLRGEAGERQVQGARLALTENGGGWLDEDSAAMAVHILERVS